ncbi:MAG: chemotaxis protein [Leptothrix sp. (in: Bacteria)]|nr:chemotaxis protein [Leptothrix sp. (in: b-proteobacteria)]
MRFSARLTICFIAPATLFVAATTVGVLGLARTQAEFDQYMATDQKLSDGLSEMYAQGLQSGQALRNTVLDPKNARAYENLKAAQEAFRKAFTETEKVAKGTPFEKDLPLIASLRDAQETAVSKVSALVASDPQAAVKLLNTEETPAWRKLRGELIKQRKAARQFAHEAHAAAQSRGRQATAIAGFFAFVAAGVAIALGWFMQRNVQRELGGEPADARDALRRIAAGDLSVPVPLTPHADSLMAELAHMQQDLQRLVGQIRQASDSIQVASAEVATGNVDLSSRTEEAASSLQQTASSMEQLTSTVMQSASSAATATQLASTASDFAQRGGQVVAKVVSTMSDINASSRKVVDIIGVIDGIAFQTNILALNAAVEAARAGDEGRGFAVVAGEVRQLARRSAEAAKEIKKLIGDSVNSVESGAQLVEDAGKTMSELMASVQGVSSLITEISAAANEQSLGIGQVNVAVGQLDQMTQQNAALVEESAAAAESLKDQANRLGEMASRFRLGAAAA